MKRCIRRLLSLMIICSMTFVTLGFAAFAWPVSAASKPALSKKTVTLKKGKTTTIKLKNARKKVVWKSSNSKVVKVVKKKGKYRSTVTIKGLKKGKATITAKCGKKTYKCSIGSLGVKNMKSMIKKYNARNKDLQEQRDSIQREMEKIDVEISNIKNNN